MPRASRPRSPTRWWSCRPQQNDGAVSSSSWPAQGIPFDQYLKMTGMSEDAIQKESMEPALKQVRMDLAVAAIVKAENLEASDEEVENEMKNIAEKYGMDLESIKKYLPASEVKEQVIREKVIKTVADSAVAVEPEEKAEEKKEDKE
ncbi:MAG: hypothetical protein ACLUNQ_04930 [Oscillospiraceae bacterium]